jgi:leucine dehydrogenase
MTYKAAVAGLNLGGGKSVIIGDPKTTRRERSSARTAASWRR